jgi:hypothetical protein
MARTALLTIQCQGDDTLSIWRRVTRRQLPDAAAKYWMKISEVIKPIQPKTPEQQRDASLQQRVTTANQALKSERQRQKVQKAQTALTKARNAAASQPARKP